MTKNSVGFVISGDVVTMVHIEIPDNLDEPLEIVADDTWRLQKGDRAEAYCVMHKRCEDFLSGNKIDSVIIQASALTMGGTKLSHLTSAELRGVMMSAAASVSSIKTVSKAHISRTYGDRKVDEYLKDDDFWSEQVTGGALRKGSREAAMLLVAARNN